MEMITVIYIVNATLLVLHEIESAYEKEWELLNLPGGITGFLLLHVPLVCVLFYGAVEIGKGSGAGLIIGLISGIGGVVPFLVHKIIVKRNDHFNTPVSNCIIYLNIVAGCGLTVLSARGL